MTKPVNRPYKKPGPQKKTVQDFILEAKQIGECLVHPSVHAPRRVYKLRYGELMTKQYVCHKCDTIGCIRDDHHFIGSCKDNVQDAVIKGRHSCFRKGGVRFSGPHSNEAKMKISQASKQMWEKRRANS